MDSRIFVFLGRRFWDASEFLHWEYLSGLGILKSAQHLSSDEHSGSEDSESVFEEFDL